VESRTASLGCNAAQFALAQALKGKLINFYGGNFYSNKL
jgi:hypothetical protein